MKRILLAAAATVGLVAAPLAANQSQALVRASAPVEQGENLSADSNLFFIAGIAAVAAAIVLLAEDEEGAPVSP